jgi:glycosyltransferase involved in cell wall biosynthesis
MNLLVINLDKAIFSANSASLARLKEYSRLVDKIFVVVWTKEKFSPLVFGDKLFIYPTNSGCRLLYYWHSWKIAGRILSEHKIDLLFTQDPFETGLAGWLVARIYKIKLQLQIHTDVFSPYFWRESLANKIRVALARFLIKRADGLRVVSQRIKSSLLKLGVRAEKIFVLPIFTQADKIAATPIKNSLRKKYGQFDFIILMAARLSHEKNVDLAIEALGVALKKNPGLGLIIVGSGPEEKRLKRRIKALGLEKNIIFEPWTADLASYYKSADVFLLTSNYEGWGLAVVEAMAAGCPVVMTDVGCAGELVVAGQTGLVVPVGEENALSSAINEMIVNNQLRNEIKTKAMTAVKNLPDKHDYLARYKKSWEAVL